MKSVSSKEHRRILILTADAGFGHRSAANAVVAALSERYGDACEITVLNPLEDKRTPFFLRDSQSDYDKLVRKLPELYRFGYDASDAQVPAVIVEQALTVLLFEVMNDIVRSYRPDVILSTYPLYQSAIRAVLTLTRAPIPLLVSITDLVTVHRIWFNSGVDRYFVPNNLVRSLAINYGLSPDQIQITGIPVNPQVVHEQRSPQEIRRAFGWEPDLLTVLAVGSRRVDRLIETLNIINHFGMPLQVIVAAGKDQDLYNALLEIEWHVPVKVYDYVDKMPVFMKAADLIVCKAGGLVVTEALACARPLLLIDAIPGQETGNAEYVVQNGAGELVRSNLEVLETLAHWTMNDRKLLCERAENARKLGQPNAAFEVADAVWQAAHRTAAGSNVRATGRLSLIKLLARNQIRWEEDPSSPQME